MPLADSDAPAVPQGAPGLVLSAPASGSGKTTMTLALIRALTRRGVPVASAKVGPDYIDPAFHAAAGGRVCVNLDAWAMPQPLLAALAAGLGHDASLILCEGVMGLLDGAVAPGQPGHDPKTDGSTAALAARLGWPVVLVVDARGMAASAGAVVRGFRDARPGVSVAGVIFTRAGPGGHADTLRAATAALAPGVPVLGVLPRDTRLALPSRHLGLVQAEELPDLETFLNDAADLAEAHIDLDALIALARPAVAGDNVGEAGAVPCPLPPPGQRVAVARDQAFAFAYPATLAGWRAAGAEIRPFSPLADEAPAADVDAVYLPGGYPELHAGTLAGATRFLGGIRSAARRGAFVFGECGGYMVLGRGLVDADGQRHSMTGLLPVETSFAQPRLHLGYRTAATLGDTPFGRAGTRVRAHEFHYAQATREDDGANALFVARDARGRELGRLGRRVGSVAGSFLHLIAREDSA
ncbi:cobyrinate a,c-diamide synthase [Roseospira marina]|uniref:Cobyrinate a,c-diamide synthase n=1 Tax=Roseospira marina TaxID=140057 RepID=A0A5M6I471_9PROT|nr:cobyrinate a,c-diamide synthase [Roseospira marina]KAA5603014.1 cobyrinate a,c-diamide synthase [Roseospira marina]MBB4316215.1 cobyrinic acid a,c-diamide synthase [Roseospira marina]MBB5087803.1 cobyrinic acid a,c-diamide synthase [Roseospira marina]